MFVFCRKLDAGRALPRRLIEEGATPLPRLLRLPRRAAMLPGVLVISLCTLGFLLANSASSLAQSTTATISPPNAALNAAWNVSGNVSGNASGNASDGATRLRLGMTATGLEPGAIGLPLTPDPYVTRSDQTFPVLATGALTATSSQGAQSGSGAQSGWGVTSADPVDGLAGGMPGPGDPSQYLSGDAPSPLSPSAVSQAVTPLNPATNPVADPATGASTNGANTAPADPFAATGLRLGAFTLFPVLETTVGYATNPDRTTTGSGSAYARTSPTIALESDWSHYQLRLEGSASFEQSFSDDADLDVTAGLAASGEVDVSERARLTGALSYDFSVEDSSEQSSGVTVLGTKTHALSGQFAYERAAGLIGLRLSTEVDYTFYEGGETVDGTSFTASSDRNNLFVRPAARVSLSPGAVLEPFVEVGGRARLYDEASPTSGANRNAYGFDVATGLSIASGGVDGGEALLSGEVAIGYAYEDAVAASLADISAITFSGSGSYRPSDLVTLTGDLSTAISSTTLDGSAGSINYAAGVEAIYGLRANVDLSARMNGSYLTYSGSSDDSFEGSLGLGALYRVNRMMQVYGDYDFTRALSSGAGSSYTDHTVALGLRLQR